MRSIFNIATCALLSTGAWAQVVFNSVSVRTRDGQIHNYAIEREVQSLGRALAEKEARLVLPRLLPTKQHRYE